MQKITKTACVNAILGAGYVVLVAEFLFNAFRFFDDQKETILMPITMLMLLVFSVSLMGWLIFGKPVLWYLDGQKSEAVKLLARTLGFFFAIMLVFFVILL